MDTENYAEHFSFDRSKSKYAYTSITSTEDFDLDDSIKDIIHTVTWDISKNHPGFNRLEVAGVLIIKYSDDADKIFYIFTSEMDKTIEYRGIIPNCHLKDEDTYGGKIKFSYKFIPQNTDYSNFTLKVF